MSSPATVAKTAPEAAFRWRDSSVAQRDTLIAAFLGWMLNAFDVMLYSLIITRLMAVFSMDKATAGLLNALTLVASRHHLPAAWRPIRSVKVSPSGAGRPPGADSRPCASITSSLPLVAPRASGDQKAN